MIVIATRRISRQMRKIGSVINECGVIAREGERVVFRREQGGRFMLEAKDLRSDLIGRRVSILGTIVGEETVYLVDLSAKP
jgi:hypothetical protein